MQREQPKFIMMVGLPYSGKSSYARTLAKEHNAVIHSSDAIRKELYGDASDKEHNAKVFEELHRRARRDIRSGKSIIFDATNLSYKRRMNALHNLGKLDCRKVCIFMATPFDVCVERGKSRGRAVPYEVLVRMYKSIWIPYWYEGWDEIKLIYPKDIEYINVNDLFLRLRDIPHDNPHHRLSIGVHCLASSVIVSKKDGGENLIAAAFLHDIGKPFTKTFVNRKGDTTEVAHYYGHQHVSAYDSLFCLTGGEEHIRIAALIQWHMRPFEIERLPIEQQGGALYRFRKLIGDSLYTDVMLLHQADVEAH